MATTLYLPDPGAWPSTLPDTPVTPRDTLNASATSVVDTQASVSAENAPLRVIYGEVRLGPLICTVLPYLQGNVILAVWGHGEVDEIVSMSIDDVEIALGSITTLPTLGKDGTFTGGGTTPINGNVRNYTGKSAQTADTLLIEAFAGQGLTYADNLPGICYSVIYVPTGTSTGFPRINAKIRGLKVWTGATTEWSDNPAYCLADFITNATYGAKRTVDWASVASVAADCNALVGGEKRRTLNLALETVQPVQSWLDTLRTYAGCWITQDGANLKLIADKAGSVVASISHAAGQIKTIGQVKKRGVQSVPTVMSLTYTDTTALPHKPGTVTVYAAGVLAGTTPRRESTVSLPGVNRYSQATREATERLNKLTLNDLSMTLGVFDDALSLEVGDIVEVTHPIGFTAKKLRVQSVVGEYGRFELGLLEYDPAVYNDTVATAPTWADTDLPDPVAEFADTALALVPFEPGPQGEPGADGDDGADGAPGVRGTRQLYLSDAAYVSGYASYNATATSAIATATAGTTPTTPIRGDTVTFTNGTNYTYTITYTGSAWEPPGLVVDGSLLVTGSVTASKIDTRGLDIKDAAGNVVFSSGSGLSSALVSGLGSLATQNTVAAGSVTGLGSLATQNTVAVGSVTGLGALATQSTVAVGSVTGLGALATQSYATVGSTVKMPDGAVMNTSDFVNRLSQLTSGNVSTFIAAGAIGEAYIGTLTASKIDSRGLSIKDAAGNVILSAGSTLQAQIGTSANLMPNSDLSAEAHNWGLAWNAGGGSDYTIAKDLAGTPWMPAGGHQIGVVRGGTAGAASSWFDIYYTPRNIPVMPGKRYEASVYAAAHRCPVYLLLIYLDNAGAYVTEASFGPTTAGGGQDLNSWGRIGGIVTMPSGVTQVSVRLRGGATTSNDPYFWGTRFFFGEAGSAQTELSPWSPGAPGALADFGYSGALNATYGATFGSNISGQITAANVSTYIASAAIQSAQVGSLSADVINAGTLNVDRINANSIVTSKLNDGAITTIKVTDNAITIPRTRSWSGSYTQASGTGIWYVLSGGSFVSDAPSITIPSGATAFVRIVFDFDMSCGAGDYMTDTAEFYINGTAVKQRTFSPTRGEVRPIQLAHDTTLTAGTYRFELMLYHPSYGVGVNMFGFLFTVTATFK